MRIYTVHVRRTNSRAVLVREGFAWGALLFGPLWLWAQRAWLAGLAALAVFVAVAFVPSPWRGLPMAAAMILLGLVGRDLVRLALSRRGYRLVSVVTGTSRDAAFVRFMDAQPVPQTIAGPADPGAVWSIAE